MINNLYIKNYYLLYFSIFIILFVIGDWAQSPLKILITKKNNQIYINLFFSKKFNKKNLNRNL
jgi:hypothetical protein